jgi:hypothetical protein
VAATLAGGSIEVEDGMKTRSRHDEHNSGDWFLR